MIDLDYVCDSCPYFIDGYCHNYTHEDCELEKIVPPKPPKESEQMLIFPLKKQWYEKIKSGEKTVEYREVKPYWNKRFHNEAFMQDETNVMEFGFYEDDMYRLRVSNCSIPCYLRLGYTNKYMTATITKIEVVDGKNTDLHIDKPVYAIHLSNVKEIDK